MKKKWKPNPSPKILENILRLGDITRNNQVGEVSSALEKAQQWIVKYGWTQYQSQLDRLKENLVKYLLHRERLSREEFASKQHQSYQSSSRRYERDSEWFKEKGRAERYARKEMRRQRAEKRKEERKAWRQPSTLKDEIIWIYDFYTKDLPPRKNIGGKRGRERWKLYYGSKTVGEFYKNSGTWRDLRRLELNHFIAIKRAS